MGLWHGWQRAGRYTFCIILGKSCLSTNVGEGEKSSQKLMPAGPVFHVQGMCEYRRGRLCGSRLKFAMSPKNNPRNKPSVLRSETFLNTKGTRRNGHR